MTKQTVMLSISKRGFATTPFEPKNRSDFFICASFMLFWYKGPVNIQNLFEEKKKEMKFM